MTFVILFNLGFYDYVLFLSFLLCASSKESLLQSFLFSFVIQLSRTTEEDTSNIERSSQQSNDS